MVAIIVGAYALGMAIGMIVYGKMAKSVLQEPWLICENCKYRKEAEEGRGRYHNKSEMKKEGKWR